MVVSNIFYFHHHLGKIPILTNIFSKGLKPPTRFAFGVEQTREGSGEVHIPFFGSFWY